MKDFIKINETRIRKSVVKKYEPIGDNHINIYFNTSRYKIDVEMFKCENRKEMLEYLDTNFLL